MENDERLFSHSAEAAVIGSMIIDPDCIEKVLAFVGVQDFAITEHKPILQAILDLHSEGKPIDGLLVRNALEERKELEKIGGIEYLGEILNNVPSSANAEYYAGIVKDKARRRRATTAVENMQKILDSDDQIGQCVFQIQQIAAGLDGAIEPGGDSKPIIVGLSDVQPLPIDWFWYNKIPMGMLTLIIGDPGLGKSFLTLFMAAKVSTGGTWPDDGVPDNSAPMGSVVILTAEDDLAHVVRPRLDSLGADTNKIVALEGVKIRNEDDREYQEYFNLQRDLPALQQTVRSQKDTKLVIIDPLSAYLGGKIDSHKDADVRSVLRPLVELAEQFGVAIVGVMHLNKNTSSKAVYRAMGSIAFTAAARTCWLVSKVPDDPDSRRRLLIPAKHNVLIEPTGLAFEITDGRVVFEGEPINITADEALGQGSTVAAPKKEQAVKWLKNLLSNGQAIATVEVSRLAKEQGITESTLRAAKDELRVVSYPLTPPDGKKAWFIQMPEEGYNKDDTQQ